MSYRMIIADDEKMLIQLVRKLGHFEQLGIEIIDECYDGESALESILKNRPDFVLSDIQMPVYDGLELIRRVNLEAPDILFVLLSGYRYFEYARSAIQLNVVDYLLKPVEEQQLNEILSKVCRLVDQKRADSQDRASLESYQSAEEERRRRAFLEEILKSGDPGDPVRFSREQISETYGIQLSHPLYQVLVIDTSLTEILGAKRIAYQDKLARFLKESFPDRVGVFHFADTRRDYLLLNYGVEDKSAVSSGISMLFYSIRDLGEIYGDFRVTIGQSEPQTDTPLLPEAASQALISSYGRFIFYGSQIIRYSQIADLKHVPQEDIVSARDLKSISESVRYFRTDELGDPFQGIAVRVQNLQNPFPGDLLNIFRRVREAVLSAVQERQEREELAMSMEEAEQKARSADQVIRAYYQEADKYTAGKYRQLSEKMAKPVEETIRFVRRRYGEAISLEDAAQQAGVSASYLSRVFKEKTGSGFSEYLTQVRIEESQRLLSMTSLSVKEIAMQVGYPDEKYYAKLFKKMTGIKPSDYRRLYG